MSLAQDIRNAYDWRDREGLERLLKKVEEIQELSELRRVTLEQGRQIATLQGEVERCTCQSGPCWRLLIGGIGEPTLCADCKKPITITANCGPAPYCDCGSTWGPSGIGHAAWCNTKQSRHVVRPAVAADSNDDRGASRGPTVCTCGAVYGYPHNEGCAKA